ncbi:MAG: glycosyltransferase family protein [Alphaproteobacteria bacterium]|nr:glycosyltransferase family protein [Alphaproteobacteria bacterium]
MTDKLLTWADECYREAHAAFNQGLLKKAEGFARSLLAALPQHGGAALLMGLCALALGRHQEAVAWLDSCKDKVPEDGQRLAALGLARKGAGDLRGAIEALAVAASLMPLKAEVRVNLANLLQDCGEFEESLSIYRQAAALEPDNAQLRYNLGMTLLTLGRFEEGWTEAEWRWKAAGLDLERVDFQAPAWHGEEMGGRTLLLWAEQGLGDTIMFCRYVPMLAAKGIKILLQAPRILHPLLTSLKGLSGLYAEGDPLPPFDAHAPLLAVPGRMKTCLETIPGEAPYLHPPKDRQDFWRQELAGLEGLKAGLVWRGNPNHPNDVNRSLSPALLTPLLNIKGIDWMAIQPEVGAEAPPIANAGPRLTDWGDTAGLLANLDLVIAVDTSTAHLAGALARPCWLLLPALPDWRWMEKRTDSPWYPTMTLFRQESLGDWEGAVSRLGEALSVLPRAIMR